MTTDRTANTLRRTTMTMTILHWHLNQVRPWTPVDTSGDLKARVQRHNWQGPPDRLAAIMDGPSGDATLPAHGDATLPAHGAATLPAHGAAIQSRWQAHLVPSGGAGVTGAGGRTPLEEGQCQSPSSPAHSPCESPAGRLGSSFRHPQAWIEFSAPTGSYRRPAAVDHAQLLNSVGLSEYRIDVHVVARSSRLHAAEARGVTATSGRSRCRPRACGPARCGSPSG